MQHQAVFLDLRRLFLDLSLKRGALSSSSSVKLKLLLPPQADRRRPGTNEPAWAWRPGSGPAVEWAAVRRSGLAWLLPAAAAARGVRRVRNATSFASPPCRPLRPLGWGEAMLCGGPARESLAGPKCAGMLG